MLNHKIIDMSKVERFEDLKVWQFSRELCKMIHKLTLRIIFLGILSLLDK